MNELRAPSYSKTCPPNALQASRNTKIGLSKNDGNMAVYHVEIRDDQRETSKRAHSIFSHDHVPITPGYSCSLAGTRKLGHLPSLAYYACHHHQGLFLPLHASGEVVIISLHSAFECDESFVKKRKKKRFRDQHERDYTSSQAAATRPAARAQGVAGPARAPAFWDPAVALPVAKPGS